MIEHSLQWANIETKMLKQSMGLSHGSEVRKMIRNIQSQVVLLSKAEVEARRGKKLKAQELLEQINKDIEIVVEYLVVAALLG